MLPVVHIKLAQEQLLQRRTNTNTSNKLQKECNMTWDNNIDTSTTIGITNLLNLTQIKLKNLMKLNEMG